MRREDMRNLECGVWNSKLSTTEDTEDAEKGSSILFKTGFPSVSSVSSVVESFLQQPRSEF